VSIIILTTTSQPVAAVNSYQIPNVPDLGQHSQCWCWCASAANALYWYSQHGYLRLLDNRLNLTENDNTYNQLIGPHPVPPAPADMVHRLLHEIAIDCLNPGVPETGENVYTFPASTWGFPINNLPYFIGLQEFINEQGASLTVREILDPASMPAPYPGEDNINVFWTPPTLDNYEKEIAENHPVLLWLNFIHTSPYYEEMDHVVTGVGYYDGGPGSQTITVADPWTAGNPDHNNNYASMVYDTLTVTNSAPLTVYYPAGSASPVQVIGLISISPTVPPAPVENYKMDNMPDLGQHCENWCWTASAANVFKWYYHNGYPKVLDDPNTVGLDNSYLQWLQTPPTDPLHDNVLRLLHEIAKDCLYPNVAEENENTQVPWPITFCNPIDDNRYFYGLQKFIREQGGQFKVSEILDNSYFVNPHQGLPPENIPPENDNVVIYDQPTFDNYKNLLKLGGVLLQLDFRNYNYETGNLEALCHIVTGVSYYDNGPGNQRMQVSDSWTPLPGPNHNDNEDYDVYDTLTVTSNDPLMVVYTGYTPSGPVTLPVQVVKLISISPVAVSENFTLHLVAGWNLVGFCLSNSDMTPNKLFPSMAFTMYYWEAPYGPLSEPSNTLPVKDNLGYWIYLTVDKTVTYSGVRGENCDDNMRFVAGWNLVHFSWTSANTTPNKLFPSMAFTMYYWEAPYGPLSEPSNTLPVKDNLGYWIYLDVDYNVTIPIS
jgi:hypothetical protein